MFSKKMCIIFPIIFCTITIRFDNKLIGLFFMQLLKVIYLGLTMNLGWIFEVVFENCHSLGLLAQFFSLVSFFSGG